MNKTYSVSCMSTKDDNGVCYSFTTREEAESCRTWLKSEGCYYVSLIF